jgi:RNA polymerase sigma-70 factor (sigma-E family)
MARLTGGAPAWEAEYVEYVTARQRSFMRAAYAMLGSWPAAEDAVQTTLTELYARWPRIRGGHPDAYGRRALVNTCIGISRKRRREVVTDRVPEGATGDGQESVDLMDALARLSVRDRAVLALRYLEDLPVREVAAALDLPEGTVKSQASRALVRLEALLSPAQQAGETTGGNP